MSEIGSGGGSSFPTSLDTETTPETASDYVRLDWGNDVAACIVAIEAALGVAPAGSYATVVARLNGLSATAGGTPKGLASARPAASAGVFYYSTDLGILEFSDGSNWHPLLGG
jgi:hypothetical protein